MKKVNTTVTDHINTRGQGSLTYDLILCTFTDPWPYHIALDKCIVGVHNRYPGAAVPVILIIEHTANTNYYFYL